MLDVRIVTARIVAPIPIGTVATTTVAVIVVVGVRNVSGIRIDRRVVPVPGAAGPPPPAQAAVMPAMMPASTHPNGAVSRPEAADNALMKGMNGHVYAVAAETDAHAPRAYVNMHVGGMVMMVVVCEGRHG